jgi:hypothetical protein
VSAHETHACPCGEGPEPCPDPRTGLPLCAPEHPPACSKPRDRCKGPGLCSLHLAITLKVREELAEEDSKRSFAGRRTIDFEELTDDADVE